jgi:DNA repair exonuclease SbcCD nuclease subunit
MKILAFSDLHVPVTQSLGSTSIEPTIDWLISTIREKGVDLVVFGGDLVDNASNVKLPVSVRVKTIIERFRALSVPVYWLMGNHDVYSDDVSMLSLFDNWDQPRLVTQPTVVACGINLVFYPYCGTTFDIKEAENWLTGEAARVHPPRAVFCHIPVDGAMMNGVKDTGVNPECLALFDTAFVGHYHEPIASQIQVLGGDSYFYVMGTVAPQSFREQGGYYGAWLWNSESRQCEFLPNPCRHLFISGTTESVKALVAQSPVPTNQVHVRLTDSIAKPEEFGGLRSVQVRPTVKPVDIEVTAFTIDSSPLHDVEAWIDASEHKEQKTALMERARRLF